MRRIINSSKIHYHRSSYLFLGVPITTRMYNALNFNAWTLESHLLPDLRFNVHAAVHAALFGAHGTDQPSGRWHDFPQLVALPSDDHRGQRAYDVRAFVSPELIDVFEQANQKNSQQGHRKRGGAS